MKFVLCIPTGRPQNWRSGDFRKTGPLAYYVSGNPKNSRWEKDGKLAKRFDTKEEADRLREKFLRKCAPGAQLEWNQMRVESIDG